MLIVQLIWSLEKTIANWDYTIPDKILPDQQTRLKQARPKIKPIKTDQPRGGGPNANSNDIQELKNSKTPNIKTFLNPFKHIYSREPSQDQNKKLNKVIESINFPS